MADWGIKISNQGKSVLESPNPLDYSVWSKYKDFKITKKGKDNLVIPDASSQATAEIPHGLTYAPAYFIWVDIDNNGTFWMVDTDISGSSFTNHLTDSPQSDTTNISFIGERDGSTGNENMPYRYVIFDQPGVDPATGSGKPIGYSTSDHGIKASQEGKSVLDANLYEQTLNSNNEGLKYLKTVTRGIEFNDAANGEDSVVISHGLNYVPMFLVWGKIPDSSSTFDKDRLFPLGVSAQQFATGASADIQNITIYLQWAGSGAPATRTLQTRIVIFQNDTLV